MLRASAACSGSKMTWLARATWKTPSLPCDVMRLTKSRRKPRRRRSVKSARRKVTRHSVRSARPSPGESTDQRRGADGPDDCAAGCCMGGPDQTIGVPQVTSGPASLAGHRRYGVGTVGFVTVELLIDGAELVATLDADDREIAGGWVAITRRPGGGGRRAGDRAAAAAAGCARRRLPGDPGPGQHPSPHLPEPHAGLPTGRQRLAVQLADHALPASGPGSTRRRPTSPRGSAWPSWPSAAARRPPITSTSTRGAAAT